MYERWVLFEKMGADPPTSIGSLLAIPGSPEVVISAHPLIPTTGKEFYVSLDGTSKDLWLIDAREVSLPPPNIPPFAYMIRRLKPRTSQD